MVPVEKLVPVQTIVTKDVPVMVETCVKQDVPIDVEKVRAPFRRFERLPAASLHDPQVVIQEVSVPTPVEKVCSLCYARWTHVGVTTAVVHSASARATESIYSPFDPPL